MLGDIVVVRQEVCLILIVMMFHIRLGQGMDEHMADPGGGTELFENCRQVLAPAFTGEELFRCDTDGTENALTSPQGILHPQPFGDIT